METLAASTTNPEQRKSVIRFALSGLGAQNAHHQFEHICRHLAAQRIASNIVPATGPVSRGGDQGRDFETFKSYLRGGGGDARFIGLVEEGVLAFSCTLQQDGLRGKVFADVEAITGSGRPVEGIYVFCERNVSVAERHGWEEEARDRGVELHVLDGNWIAEHLAKSDAYWIAQQFLSLPASAGRPPRRHSCREQRDAVV